MANNYGKIFESKFKSDWLKIPESTIDRLYDTTNGFKGISQISDFIGYKYPNIFYLECKTIKGNTFPFSNLHQFDKLWSKKSMHIPGVRIGVILWFIDHDCICYCPISSIYNMKKDNKKSVHINYVKNKEYGVIEIPSIKKRTYLEADYSILTKLNDKEEVVN